MQSISTSEAVHIVDRLTEAECRALLKKILRVLWPFLKTIRPIIEKLISPAQEEKAMITAHLEILNDGVRINGCKLLDGLGGLLKFAVLKYGDGVDEGWPRDWHWRLHGTFRPERFSAMNGAAKKQIEKELSRPLIYVECQRPAQRRGTGKGQALFGLTTGPQVELAGPVVEARKAWEDAKALLEAGRSRDAAERVITAVSSCPLLWWPYKIARECLRYDDGRRALMEDDVNRGVLVRGMRQLRQWLDWLEEGFDFDVIPACYHDRVKTDCIQELSMYRRKLDDLTAELGEDGTRGLPPQNPLNVVLDVVREASGNLPAVRSLEDLLSDEMKQELQSMRDEAVARISSLRGFVLRQSGLEALHGALLLASRDPAFRFPEPDGTSDSWRGESIRMWIKLFRKHYDDRPRIGDTCGDVIDEIPDDSSPDDPLV